MPGSLVGSVAARRSGTDDADSWSDGLLADKIRLPGRLRSSYGPIVGDRPRAAYRRDLDGLRGLAIALVAVFHVWFGRVSGGVDVFLVLSGYFFGAKLLRTALDPTASLSVVSEVARLLRRLLPALVTVLAGAAVLTVLVQPQTRWATFADQTLASLGYFQNWELAATASNYLRAGEAVSPMQHIWSMVLRSSAPSPFLASCVSESLSMAASPLSALDCRYIRNS